MDEVIIHDSDGGSGTEESLLLGVSFDFSITNIAGYPAKEMQYIDLLSQELKLNSSSAWHIARGVLPKIIRSKTWENKESDVIKLIDKCLEADNSSANYIARVVLPEIIESETWKDKETTVIKLIDKCLKADSSSAGNIAWSVLPKIIKSKTWENKETTVIKLIDKCLEADSSSAVDIARDVLPDIIESETWKDKRTIVIKLIDKCLKADSSSAGNIAWGVLPKIIKSKTWKNKETTVIKLIDKCLKADSSSAGNIAWSVLPKIIKSKTWENKETTVIKLIDKCLEADSSSAVDIARDVLPDIIESETWKDKRTIVIKLIDKCLKADSSSAGNIAWGVLPKIIKSKTWKNKETTVMDLVDKCLEADSSSDEHIARVVLPRLIEHKYDYKRIVKILHKTLSLGYFSPIPTTITDSERNTFLKSFLNIDSLGLSGKYKERVESLLNSIFKEYNTTEEFIHHLRDNVFYKHIDLLKPDFNNDNIKPEVLIRKAMDMIVEEIIFSDKLVVIDFINENKSFIQVLEILGISVTGRYGINTKGDVNIPRTNILQDQAKDESTYEMPKTKARYMLKDPGNPIDLESINELIRDLNNQLSDDKKVEELEGTSYFILQRLLHDEVQERLRGVEGIEEPLSKLEQLVIEQQDKLKLVLKGTDKKAKVGIREIRKGTVGRMLMGAFSNACYKGVEIPSHIDSFVYTRGGLVKGGFLVIRTEVAGKKAVILRAVNPTENVTRELHMRALLQATYEYARNNYEGEIYFTVDEAGGASTNRPVVAAALEELKATGHLAKLEPIKLLSSSIFNGYKLGNKLFRVAATGEQ